MNNGGFPELYKLDTDQFERQNLADQPGNETDLAVLSGRLKQLKTCGGAENLNLSCRTAEER